MTRAPLWIALIATGCAGARSAAPAQETAGPGAQAPEAPAYERILGAFVVSPTGFVLLDPDTCGATACGERGQAEGVLSAAELTQVPAAIAAAKLNLGALLWQDGEGDAAYQSIRSAQGLFAEAGDAVGIALCHEWIGFMLLRSGADEPASDHLALAHQLYDRLGDQAAEARVLRYVR